MKLPWRKSKLPATALAIAEHQALHDRAILAHLRAQGVVQFARRDVPSGMREYGEVKAFIAEVEGQAFPKRNLAIKPTRRKR